MTLLHILQGFQKGSEHFQKIRMYKESECRQMMHATIKKKALLEVFCRTTRHFYAAVHAHLNMHLQNIWIR